MIATPQTVVSNPNVSEVAAEWWAQHVGGAMSDAQRLELAAWLAHSTDHELAWARLQATWSALDALKNSSQVANWRGAIVDSPRANKQAWYMGLVATIAVSVSALWLARAPTTPQAMVQSLPVWGTAVGEVKTFALSDGSQVTLSTRSTARVVAWEITRTVSLDSGEAYFVVAKDATRPFVVTVGTARVTAVGTEFSVRRDARLVAVVLTEGRVRLSDGPNQNAELVAGQQAVFQNGRWQVSGADTRRATSWREGRLAFEGEPLSHVVAEMNRYSATQLIVAAQSLSDIPISGVFRAGDNVAFARTLQSYGLARIGDVNAQRIELKAIEK